MTDRREQSRVEHANSLFGQTEVTICYHSLNDLLPSYSVIDAEMPHLSIYFAAATRLEIL
jgi:hypothetical protein